MPRFEDQPVAHCERHNVYHPDCPDCVQIQINAAIAHNMELKSIFAKERARRQKEQGK